MVMTSCAHWSTKKPAGTRFIAFVDLSEYICSDNGNLCYKSDKSTDPIYRVPTEVGFSFLNGLAIYRGPMFGRVSQDYRVKAHNRPLRLYSII